MQYLILGAKARALLHGRTHVSTDDIQALARPVLRHRLVVNFAAESEGITPDDIVDRLLDDHPHQRGRTDARCPIPKDFCILRAIARISRLEVRARHIVEGFLSGIHRSPYFGQSIEFLQHREYTPGDDLRHIDWKVWAKQDRYYVKQYEEDTNLRARCWSTFRGSMQLRLGPAEQVRIRLHDRRVAGLSAVAAAGRGRLRGVRRDGRGPRCRCAPSATT